jgi:polyisoprenyl-teichoic acid--peptidoglycan teichoic acid transferase
VTALAGVRRWGRGLALLATVAVLVPAGAVHPTTISLTTIGTARAVDAGSDVLWVLALGSEAAPGEDVMQGRTDAIQLIGVDWENRRAVAIGLPRDLWVELDDGRGRLNSALQEDGTEGVARQVTDLVGITPDLVLVTGFEGFLTMLGAVGEVEVDSPIGFTTEEGGVVVRPGTNTFDARQALLYARTREGLPESDYDRAANHQRLLLGVLARLRAAEDEAGYLEATTLAALSGLETDLSPTELYRVVQALTTIDPRRTATCIVRGEFGVEFGADVVYPDYVRSRAIGADAEDDLRLQDGCPG